MLDETDRQEVRAKAAELWQSFTTNEKNLVRFGMFPAERMRQVESEAPYNGTDRQARDLRHGLTCALMDCAKADGGMRA